MKLENEFSGIINVELSNSTRSLYMHQKDAIKALNEGSKKDIYKSLLVIPTGGGKTFTSIYWVLNQIIDKNKKVLWLAHRHELLNQTIKTAMDSAYKDILPNRDNFKFRIISGVHDRPVNIDKNDDFIVASKDSLNNGKEYLKKWVEENKDNICLIIDEAHHAVAKSYRNIINILESTCKKDLKIIGLTATPMRTDEKEKGLLGKIFSDNICYSVDLNTLINKGILSQPVLRSFDTKVELENELTKADIRAIKMSSNLPENIARQIALNKKRNNFIVNSYIEHKDEFGKCLVFAVNIDHALVLNALFNENNIKSDYVVSSVRDMYSGVTISNEENARKIQDFKAGKLDVLINVNILTEGTDIPSVQSVFLTRPTTSAILMNQMIGRGLRGVSAGGTEKAYIVSFIDDWKGKINWISPNNIIISGGFKDQPRRKSDKLENTLIPIKLIEEFAKFINGNVTSISSNYMDIVPIGSYNFTLFNEENETEEICEVLVFKPLKEPFEQLMNNMNSIFRKYDVEVRGDAPTEEELEKMYDHILNNEFEGYDLDIGFNENDIKDIFRYYDLTEETPLFIPFEGREKYDVSVLAKEIVDNDFGPRKQNDYLNEKWKDEQAGWKIYFNNNKHIFINEVNRAVYNELNKGEIESPEVEYEKVDYSKLSMSQIYKKDINYWRKLSDAVYKKYQDEDGYYKSATGIYKSKSKKYFQIDHIKPMSKGGLTVLENLQLLTRWENYNKGDKFDEEIKTLDIDSIEEAMLDCYDEGEIEKARELSDIVLERDSKSIAGLNIKADLEFDKGNYNGAISYSNKVLSIVENQEYALCMKAMARFNNEKYNLCIDTLNEYITEVDDKDIWALCLKGECYIKLKEWDNALEAFKNVIDIEENNSDANFYIAYIYDRKRKYDLAIEYYDKVLKEDSQNDSALNNKGYTLYKVKKYEEAIKCYDRAIEINADKKYIRNKKEAVKKLEELKAFNI
ncbi:tetratricopeptide repeat protein [Paeniclostridium sordellii]|uniref:DEAD/DEAH box helicase family protein n=1 Tax=Paraclostridium sordellii TaxID=1505 RepID=UPI0012ECE6CB|nr:DEAD/DEAH box helicase family protein [Paeniclostridium sordellii]MVO69985.1 tetratricopeptide repeat protein [Paeniclostridium sordellii]